jgi:hypothetical protein
MINLIQSQKHEFSAKSGHSLPQQNTPHRSNHAAACAMGPEG